MPTNVQAAIWARVSSSSQTELSLDGQVERVKQKLEDKGFIIPPQYIFKVVWTSLDLELCPEFQELKRLIRDGRIVAVGFFDRDRLEAVGIQRLTFLSLCSENSVQPIVYQGAVFMQEAEGQIVELALAIGKERSVRRAQSGAKQGLRDRALLKRLPPTAKNCYGYKWHDGKYAPTADHPHAVAIWQMIQKGMPIKRMAKELEQQGIRSPRGNPSWAASSIRAILQNPVYAGRIAVLKYEKTEPKHRTGNTYGKTSHRALHMKDWHFIDIVVDSSIVSWEQFLAVQERIKLNKLYAERNSKHNYLLRGLIECQSCHRRYYGVQRTHQKPAYVCSNAWAQHLGKRCQAKPITISLLEEEVKFKIESFFKHPEVFLHEAEKRKELTNNTVDDIEKLLIDLEKQYDKTIEDERRAFNVMSDEAFKREQLLLTTKRKWTTEEIERRKIQLIDLKQSTLKENTVDAMLKNLEINLDKASDKDWRYILEALGTKILAFIDGTWDIEVNIPTENPIVNTTGWYTCPCSRPAIRRSPAVYRLYGQPQRMSPPPRGRPAGHHPA